MITGWVGYPESTLCGWLAILLKTGYGSNLYLPTAEPSSERRTNFPFETIEAEKVTLNLEPNLSQALFKGFERVP